MIFYELLAEAQTWDGGFTVSTSDPVCPTFSEELRLQHYPELDAFEVNDDLEVELVVTEIDGDPTNTVTDVIVVSGKK